MLTQAGTSGAYAKLAQHSPLSCCLLLGHLLQGWSVPWWEENTLATLQRLPQLSLETNVYVKLSSWVLRMEQVWIRKRNVVESITLRLMNTKQLKDSSCLLSRWRDTPRACLALDSCHSSSPLFYFFLGFWTTSPTWFSGHLTERSLLTPQLVPFLLLTL